MYTYRFYNDYSEGAHPRLLELLASTNDQQEDGYGNDALSQQATALLQHALAQPAAAVHFVSGGTQANLVVLAALLKPYESVIAAQTAHINVHEAGAIEATGHKIHGVATPDGKLTPAMIQAVVAHHTDEHMVKPRVVFISHATELGTVYSKRELEALAQVCRDNGLYLHLDGARLGPALASAATDVALPDLARLVDVLCIGGTKNGALFGEAIAITTPALQENFRYHMKQHGALLAKGRVLGAQFVGLFRDDLSLALARHANALAARLADGLRQQGVRFLVPVMTNQLFPILPTTLIRTLQEHYGFYVWTPVDATHAAIRLVTSWATPEASVDAFLRAVQP
ncbi:MAG: aminotransferase class V-fold PLP-dependent enzyme [bacterium]|nr:aminotransferase class V-fold PLP-dependent enzyme [bacterium]